MLGANMNDVLLINLAGGISGSSIKAEKISPAIGNRLGSELRRMNTISRPSRSPFVQCLVAVYSLEVNYMNKA